MKKILLLCALVAVLMSAYSCTGKERDTHGIPQADLAAFEDLRTQASGAGEVLVINVFASWCPPCKEETPDFVELHTEMAGQNVRLVGYSIDENPVNLAAFIERYHVSYPVFLIDSSLQRKLFVDKVPTTMIFKPDGQLYSTRLGSLTKQQLKNIIAAAKEM